MAKIFILGGTGALGRQLIPLLIERGHDIIALARNPDQVRDLRKFGIQTTSADPLNEEALAAAIYGASPEIIIHQLSVLSDAFNLWNCEAEHALINRFRTEVTHTLLQSARAFGVRRLIAQSFCGWPFARQGSLIKTEEAPLDPDPPDNLKGSLAAIRYLERAVQDSVEPQALALRYGVFYGPGTNIANDGAVVEFVRKRKLPVIGNGTGIWSFTHVGDAARATVAAISHGSPGIYNIVDDEPAPIATWLPALAAAVGVSPPRKIPAWLARLVIDEAGMSLMTTARGGSNAKAKRELDWKPVYSSWRRGFVEGLE